MRVSTTLCMTATLTSIVTLGLAAPAISNGLHFLIPRSEVCYNAPATIAGTFLDRRNLIAKSPIPYRIPKEIVNPLLWCAPHCETYVEVTYISAIPGQSWIAVQNLMHGAKAGAQQHLRAVGDGIVRGGTFTYRWHGMEVFIHDSNNHQLTWGVLDSALTALTEYFEEIQQNNAALPGSVTFVVHDGKNEVGTGALGAVQFGMQAG